MTGIVEALAALFLLLFTFTSSLPSVASWAIAQALSAQFGPFQALQVDVVDRGAFELPSGTAHQVSVHARGFVVQGIPVLAGDLDSSELRVDPVGLIFEHRVALGAPATFSVHVAMSGEGLDALLHNPQLRAALTNMPVSISPFPGINIDRVDVVPSQVLLTPGRIELRGDLRVGTSAIDVPFDVAADPAVVGGALELREPSGTFLGSPLPPDLLAAALHPIPLRPFLLPSIGGQIRLQNVTVAADRLDIMGEARLDRL